MADERGSTSNVAGESSDTEVDINIKTLDSHLYNLRVDKHMLVSAFKEKIASNVGLPVGQQQLIFGGKVLKDEHRLSAYHVESGDTLHLVARQPSESQHSSGSSTGNAAANGSNTGQAVNVDASTSRRKKKICKKVPWHVDEEELLASLWIHVSENSVVGNDQKGPAFWLRMMTEYNKVAPPLGFTERTRDQLSSKFTSMNTAVKAFIGYYADAKRTRGSRHDDMELMDAATKMYCECEKANTFRYPKCWSILKDNPKWKIYAKIDQQSTNRINLVDDHISDDIFVDDPTPQPPGIERGEKRKEPSFASENAQEKSFVLCGSLLEEFKKLTKTKKETAKIKQQTLRAQEEAAYASARNNDIAFLTTSTAGMSEREAEWIESEKYKIREKYGMN